MTFVSWADGDMDWGFGGNTSLIDRHQRLISDELGPWRLLWEMDRRKFVGYPNTFTRHLLKDMNKVGRSIETDDVMIL